MIDYTWRRVSRNRESLKQRDYNEVRLLILRVKVENVKYRFQ